MHTLRLMPVLLGIATLLVAYRVGSRVMGRRAGLVFLAFVCLSDILAFVNSRGDFSESLSVPLTIGLVCLIGRPNRSILRGVLCLGLLMTGLGKGMFVVGLMVVAQLTVAAMMPGHRRSYAREIAITLAVAFVPTILYLWIASLWFSSAGIIHHDAVAATGICDLINKLVIHYAQTKAHVSGTALDAAMVWWDPGIWPATVLGGAVLLAGLVSVPVRLARIRFRPKSRREAVQIALAVWALAGLAVILVRGTAGARYHLMYLPALWMLAAFWLGPRIATPIGRIVALAALSLWAAAISTAGPLAWAPYARFEPMYGSEELAALDAYRAGATGRPEPHGRTLYIDLANYYLRATPTTPRNIQLAVHYARLETRRAPDDARAWFYLGETLRRQGAPAIEFCEAWRRSRQLKASDAITERLRTFCAHQDAPQMPAPKP